MNEHQPVRKKDAMRLLLGKPAFVDDVTPRDCLVVKVLRSPHAHALIEEISTEIALKVPGIEAIFTYRDVPDKRFTMAGQTYPEPSTAVCALSETRLPWSQARVKKPWTAR